MKSCLLCLLGLVFFSCVSDARGDLTTTNITATNERYVRRRQSDGSTIVISQTTGAFGLNDGLVAGKFFLISSTYTGVGILPFALPEIPVGHIVVGANLSFSARRYGSTSFELPAADLYGLDFRTSNTVLTSDYYFNTSGDHDMNPSVALIQDSILSSATTLGIDDYVRFDTDASADFALVSYLNDQVTAGAVADDFAFFRINTDANLNSKGYKIGYSGVAGLGAELTITTSAVPEPSAFLFGTLVCVVSGLRFSRRDRRCRAQ